MTKTSLLATMCGVALVLAGCATTAYSGKIVSCADQKPIPAAALKFTGSIPGATMGEMPANTKDDGSYDASITTRENNVITLTVNKDGYATKQEQLTAGAPQTICLDKQ
jgi:hypothetical protein